MGSYVGWCSVYTALQFPQRLLVLAKQLSCTISQLLSPVVAAKALEDHLHSSYAWLNFASSNHLSAELDKSHTGS